MVDIRETLNEFGIRLIDDIKDNMASEGYGDSNLAKSLEYEIGDRTITVYADGYWKYAQLGRGPGKVPRNFVDILLNWMQRYNVHANDGNDARFANAIKWNIIRKGSSVFRGDRKEKDFIGDAVKDNMEWLEQQLYVDIKKQFDLDLARDEIHGNLN